jgi:(p)ppGpp synthase/HD superfamily hydrolase
MRLFSPRMHQALDFASVIFQKDFRKDPDVNIPTVSHLVGVAFILAGYGFDEDVLIAGILHDFHEDIAQTPRGVDRKLVNRVRREFGSKVLELVEYVTQRKYERGEKTSWTLRNKEYKERLCSAKSPEGAKAISCADKIHNIQSLLMALERNGPNDAATWKRLGLKKTPREQIDKFKDHYHGLAEHWQHPILREFGGMIKKLESRLIASDM